MDARTAKSKWVRILVILGSLTALGAIYLWFFGIATMFVIETRYIARKAPIVKKAPVELTDLSISQSPGRKLNYLGYEFEVPWNDVDDDKTKQVGEMHVIVFRSGNSISFSRAQPKEFVNAFLSSAKDDPDMLRKLYGEDALQSDYRLKRLILESTPDKVTLFTSRKDSVRNAMLLLIKGVMVPNGGDSGIYWIRTSHFQGYQYGDPRSRPKSLEVELFNENEGLGFIFSQKEKATTSAISQGDINRVIQTVQKISGQPSGAGR
jgi:hypothetical protein